MPFIDFIQVAIRDDFEKDWLRIRPKFWDTINVSKSRGLDTSDLILVGSIGVNADDNAIGKSGNLAQDYENDSSKCGDVGAGGGECEALALSLLAAVELERHL